GGAGLARDGEHGADGAQRVGEGHDGAAMHDVSRGAQIGADEEPGHDPGGLGGHYFDPHERREWLIGEDSLADIHDEPLLDPFSATSAVQYSREMTEIPNPAAVQLPATIARNEKIVDRDF